MGPPLRLLGACDYYGSGSCGGSERVAHEVYRRLARWGDEVTVVAAAPGATFSTAVHDGVTVVGIPAFDLSRLVGAQLAFAPRLRARVGQVLDRQRPDVVHANSIHFHGSVVAARLAPRAGLPLVTTAHVGPTGPLPGRLRMATEAYERLVGSRILGRSSHVVAVSESVARHVVGLGLGPDKVTVVPNGVDAERFHPSPERPVPDGPPHVLFVGRLIANKGPDLLLDAVAGLVGRGVEVRATFVGDGPMRAALRRSVERLDLGGRVVFTGPVDDVADRLRDADVLVRPSYTEGMPLAVLEAMASGVCVVASGIPGNAEVVDHGRTGLLFPPGDAVALETALATVLADAGLRRRLARAALDVAGEYTWDATARATREVLQSVAAVAGAGRPGAQR